MLNEKKKRPSFIKVPFSELDESVQKKLISELFTRSCLFLFSLVNIFFIDTELALFLILLLFLYLAITLHYLYLFLSDKMYYLDAEYLGIWNSDKKIQKLKNIFWTKPIKKQITICLMQNDEHYFVTLNKTPSLIIGDYVRICAVPESIYKGTDGTYRVSGVFHIYKLKNTK